MTAYVFPELTMRQRQVAIRICYNCSPRMIARQLGIGLKTYDTHRLRLLECLGVDTNLGLLHLALVRGYVAAVERPDQAHWLLDDPGALLVMGEFPYRPPAEVVQAPAQSPPLANYGNLQLTTDQVPDQPSPLANLGAHLRPWWAARPGEPECRYQAAPTGNICRRALHHPSDHLDVFGSVLR